MQREDHLGFWIGLVAVLSLLAVAILIVALAPLVGLSEPIVQKQATSAPAPKPATASTLVPTPVLTRTLATPTLTAGPAQCKNNATLVKHVTSPETTPWLPNQGFTKTWQIQNVGTCAWNSTYQLAFVQNESMAAVGAIALPANTAPGQTIDLTIAMLAPATPGTHSGQWQLRDESGALFGPLLPVSITVATPPPTACTPQIASFTSDRTTINRGELTTLRWGAVTNAQRVEIDNGIGVVTTPGSRVVAPTQTTTFTLYATCGGNRVSKAVSITVTQPSTPTSTTVPASQRRNIDGIWATEKYTFQLAAASGCAGLVCQVQGEYAEWGDSSPPVPGLVNGTFNVNTGAVALTITYLPGAAKSFNGTVDASSTKMSGQLTGAGTIILTKQ